MGWPVCVTSLDRDTTAVPSPLTWLCRWYPAHPDSLSTQNSNHTITLHVHGLSSCSTKSQIKSLECENSEKHPTLQHTSCCEVLHEHFSLIHSFTFYHFLMFLKWGGKNTKILFKRELQTLCNSTVFLKSWLLPVSQGLFTWLPANTLRYLNPKTSQWSTGWEK